MTEMKNYCRTRSAIFNRFCPKYIVKLDQQFLKNDTCPVCLQFYSAPADSPWGITRCLICREIEREELLVE